ncbi:exported hypothetical protein [Agrobacterium tumefaciens str. CFBP 5621]|nr:exported hypothetical protein [Agrobacterium tumefaciens str. CFBP 5621]
MIGRYSKITAVALMAVTILLMLTLLIADLPVSRIPGLLTGAYFIYLQCGLLWSLLNRCGTGRLFRPR